MGYFRILEVFCQFQAFLTLLFFEAISHKLVLLVVLRFTCLLVILRRSLTLYRRFRLDNKVTAHLHFQVIIEQDFLHPLCL